MTLLVGVTGEKTLPALEAGHIRPYAKSGPHEIRNGLLLRSDLHNLFDLGYLTVALDYRVAVSRRIRESSRTAVTTTFCTASHSPSCCVKKRPAPRRSFWSGTNGIFKS
jgi:putative restriction endonuclease